MDVMNEKFDPLESFDLPDFHITQANCKAKVIAYGKAKGLQMKWKNGRCDQTGVCIYYVVSNTSMISYHRKVRIL